MDKSADKKQRILIIEDDRYLNRVLQLALEKAGFEALVAYDGYEGLEKIKSERPDLILLDLMLPIRDGFEILEILRVDEELKKILVIILSNLGQQSDIEKGKKLGAVDYLVKSAFSIKEIIEKIKKYLDQSPS